MNIFAKILAAILAGEVLATSALAQSATSLVVPVDAGPGAVVYVRCRPDVATGANESAYVEQGMLVALPVATGRDSTSRRSTMSSTP